MRYDLLDPVVRLWVHWVWSTANARRPFFMDLLFFVNCNLCSQSMQAGTSWAAVSFRFLQEEDPARRAFRGGETLRNRAV